MVKTKSSIQAKFTKRQVEAAIQVLKESDLVRHWALGELRAYGVNPDSPAGQEFFSKKTEEIARKILT